MARFLLAETSELFEMMSTYEGMENPPHAGLTKQPSIPDHSLINARIKAALQGIALGEITYGVPELSKDFHTLQAYFLQQRRHQLGTKYHTNDSEFNEAMIYQSSLPEHQKAKLAMTIFDSITSILGDLQVKGLSSDRFIFGSEPLRRADGFGR